MNRASQTQDIFIGIDGGSTKTIVGVENARREFLGKGEGGPANVWYSVEGSWKSISGALKEALAPIGLRQDDDRHRFYCGAGLAGTEVTSACDQFINTPHPFTRLILRSDGYTSCLGCARWPQRRSDCYWHRQTPLALTLIRQAAREIDRLGAALASQSLDKALPCSLLGGLAPFIEPWLGESLRVRLVPGERDAVYGALLMIRNYIQDQSFL